MGEKQPKSQRKPKYYSVRKALQELKVNEDDLKNFIDNGAVNPVYEEGNKAKFPVSEIEKLKMSQQQEADLPMIDDESLYESADNSMDSIFATGSTIARVSQIDKRPRDLQDIPMDISADIIAQKGIPFAAEALVAEEASEQEQKTSKQTTTSPKASKPRIALSKLLLVFVVIALTGFTSAIAVYVKSVVKPHQVVVNLEKIRKRDFIPSVVARGWIVGDINTIVATASGRVTKIHKQQGQKVKKGQLLAELTDQTLLDKIKLVKAKIAALALKVRATGLQYQALKKRISAREQKLLDKYSQKPEWEKRILKHGRLLSFYLVDLRRQFLTKELAYEHQYLQHLQQCVQALKIHASTAGKLMQVMVAQGQNVKHHDTIAKVAEIGGKTVQVNLPRVFQRHITPKLPVEIISEGNKHKALSGKVIAVTDHHEQQCRVKIAMAVQHDLAFHTRVTVKMTLPQTSARIVIPRNSIVFIHSMDANLQLCPAVFLATEQQQGQYLLRKVHIEVGIGNDELCEVIEGIAENDLLVVDCNLGLHYLRNNMIVSKKEGGL